MRVSTKGTTIQLLGGRRYVFFSVTKFYRKILVSWAYRC